MNTETITVNRERKATVLSGWVMLPIVLLLFFGGIALFIYSIVAGIKTVGQPLWEPFVTGILLEPLSIILLVGFFTLQPNEAEAKCRHC